MKKQIFGITGVISAGKTTFTKKLAEAWPTKLQIIEVDQFRLNILYGGDLEFAELRKNIGDLLNVKTFGKAHILNRVDFTEKLFKSKNNVDKFNELTAPLYKKIINNMINKYDGDSVIVWSHLLENNYDELFDGPIVFVYVDEVEYQNRVKKFIKNSLHITEKDVLKRIASCNSQEEKLLLLNKKENIIIFDSLKEIDFNVNAEKIIEKIKVQNDIFRKNG